MNPHVQNFTTDEVAAIRACLPSIHAEVLYLYAAGYTYEKIAEMVQTPIGTVRSRMFRARLSAEPLVRRYRLDHTPNNS